MKMKKLVLSLVLAVVTLVTAHADTPSQSTIHLRNGATVTGHITSRTDQVVDITTADGMNYSYTASEIDYIDHERKTKNYDKSRFRGFIDAGWAAGVGSPRNNFWLIETSFGYMLTPRAYLGAGIGLHSFKPVVDSYPMRNDLPTPIHNDPDWQSPFFPVYVNGRYNFQNESQNTPWVDLKVGATFINHKGFYASPSIGWHFATSQFFSFNVGLGYALHTAHYKLWCTGNTPGAVFVNGDSYIDQGATFHNFFLKAGIEF